VRTLGGRYLPSRSLIHQGAKFAVVGLAGVIIVIAGADVLHYSVGLGKYASVTVATVAGMIPNFAANRHWTFQHREQHVTWRETALFFALNCAGMLFQYVCIGITQAVPGMSGRFWYTTANLLGLGLGAAFRFWSYRRWVWHSPPARALPGRPEARAQLGRPQEGQRWPSTPSVSGLHGEHQSPRA
jgi:putative flippase GtrA